MNPLVKRTTSVLAWAQSLSGAIFSLTLILQPAPAASVLQWSTKRCLSVAPKSSADQAKEGASLFARNCAHCHGSDAHGDEGPDLYDLTKSDARITKIIKEGIKGQMPKFRSKFSDDQVQALIAFLRTLKG
jgi:cbb3-type cytochrome c oxidase subunit III